MGSQVRHALAVILLFVVGAAQAAPVTIDFDLEDIDSPLDYVDGLYFPASGPLLVDSFAFDDPFVGVAVSPDGKLVTCQAQSYGCIDGYGGARAFTMTHSAGQAFNLHSFEYSFEYSGPLGYCLDVYGERSDGSTVTLSQFGDSETGCDSSPLLEFSSEWSNLVEVSVVVNDYTDLYVDGFTRFDNVIVSVVPIPAAVWLFGSGLGLLGWFSCKAKKAKQAVMGWPLPPDYL